MELAELRRRMDGVNEEMLSLFLRRMALSAEIAREKEKAGLPVRDEARERECLQGLCAQSGALPPDYTARFFETLFALSRDYQTALRAGEKP